MLSTIYTSVTGLQSFSKGLDVISSNVANVNTPGFKGTQLLFQDVFYGYDVKDQRDGNLYGAWIGHGVAAEVTTLHLTQGELRNTGNDTDVAIDGKGFFVIERDGQYVYTRGGQFEFDDTGVLVTTSDKSKVMGLDESGSLVPITTAGLKTQAAKRTGTVSFVGNLALGGSTHSINNAQVIDSLGVSHSLKVLFRNTSTTTPRSWSVEVRDSDDTLIATGGQIRFTATGSPETDFNQFKFTYKPKDAAEQEVILDFGPPGSFSQATSFSGGTGTSGQTSDLAFDRQDGNVQGSLLNVTFDDRGQVVARYSNNNSVTGARLALADFNNVQSLQQLERGMFHAQPGQTARYVAAGSEGLGRIAAGRVELSNVELSQQFSDMIVVQRGYQASSQVLTAANEMIQQLLEATK